VQQRIVGLTGRDQRLVVPRAHDCITLFLAAKSATWTTSKTILEFTFKTTGWIERGEAKGELSQLTVGNRLKTQQSFEQLVARYGEENAKYLWEELGNPEKHYGKMTFIEMGIERDSSFERIAHEKADARKWEFEKVQGDMGMFQRLVDGIWNDNEFLIVPPGRRVAAPYDEGIIALEEPQS